MKYAKKKHRILPSTVDFLSLAYTHEKVERGVGGICEKKAATTSMFMQRFARFFHHSLIDSILGHGENLKQIGRLTWEL